MAAGYLVYISISDAGLQKLSSFCQSLTESIIKNVSQYLFVAWLSICVLVNRSTVWCKKIEESGDVPKENESSNNGNRRKEWGESCFWMSRMSPWCFGYVYVPKYRRQKLMFLIPCVNIESLPPT